MKKHKRKLRTNIFGALFGVILLQICIVILVFGSTGILTELDNNAVTALNETVGAKKLAMEAQMLSWSKMDKTMDKIAIVSDRISMHGRESASEVLFEKKERKEFLSQMSTIVLNHMRESKVTECFLILEGESPSSSKDALYFRDRNPEDINEGNSDIMAEAGMSSLMVENGIALDRFWNAELKAEELGNFYENPIQAGNSYKELETADLGYWSPPFRLHDNDSEMITYTVPLRDKQQNVYGVFGIGISMDYLHTVLAQNKINMDDKSSYYLGITQNGTGYHTVLAEGSYYQSSLQSGGTLQVESKRQDLYQVKYDNQQEEIVASLKKLKLYNADTPFEQETWAIAGLVRKDVLFASKYLLNNAFTLAIFISFLVSIIGALFLTKKVTHPLSLLLDGLQKSSVKRLRLMTSGVLEFDQLADEIKHLEKSVFKAGSKVADILDRANIQIGICEITNGKIYQKDVFCTKKFMEILELPMGNWSNNYINKTAFERLIKGRIEQINHEEEEADTYWYIGKGEKKHWFQTIDLEEKREEEKSLLYILIDVTDAVIEKQKIKRERDYDVLTNLFNRRAFVRQVEALLQDGICQTAVLSIWDLDNLKYMNDTYGHDIGDQYIRMFANVLHHHEGENYIAARMSGDEFMIFLYNSEVSEMIDRLQQIHRQFLEQRLVTIEGNSVSVSISAGISIYKEDACAYADLLKYADFAMYEVKKKEKGAIAVFNRDTYVRDYILVQGVGELNRILQEKAVRYAFQPIVDCKTKEIFAYEALMRPQSELLKVTSEFLRLAKEHSKLRQVEKVTWFCAMEQFADAMQEALPAEPAAADRHRPYLFINSIPNQSLSQKDFKEMERRFGGMLSTLIVESTEIADLDTAHQEVETQKRNWFQRWKIRTALDDYGAGYSNTGTLLAEQFDFVKIDMSIIRDIDKIGNKQNMADSIIRYCHDNVISVIAEGVETKEELDTLIALGADYVQGYYLARPAFEIRPLTDAKLW